MFRVNEVIADDSLRERKEAMPGVGWREIIVAGVEAIEAKRKAEKCQA